MKPTLFLLSLLVFIGYTLHAQDTTIIERNGKKMQVIIVDDEEGETQEIILNKEKDQQDVDIDFDLDFDEDDETNEIDKVKTRWFLLDIGKSTYLYNGNKQTIGEDNVNPMEQNIFGSWNVNIHLFRQRVSLIKGYVNLLWGLGFDYNQYRFSNSVSLEPRGQQVSFLIPQDPAGGSIDFDRNRLRMWYLNVPVMLNFETNPANKKRSFRLSAGGFAGLRISSNLQQEYDIFETQTNDDFNTSDFRYGLSGAIGYGWFNFYANYALNGLFEDDSNGGYDVSPLNVGVQIIPF